MRRPRSGHLVRGRPGPSGGLAGDAVPLRAPVAEPRRSARIAPASVFLAGWPDVAEPDAALAGRAEVRRVVELGRKARDASRIKHRRRRCGGWSCRAQRPARSRGGDRGGAPRQGRRVRGCGGAGARRKAEPAGRSARASARSWLRCGLRWPPASSRRLPEGRFAWRDTSSSPTTRCSSSGEAARAGRSSPAGLTVALDLARRRTAGRRSGSRPHPPAQHDAQGGRARAHRPNHCDPAGGLRTCSRTRTGSRARCSPSRSDGRAGAEPTIAGLDSPFPRGDTRAPTLGAARTAMNALAGFSSGSASAARTTTRIPAPSPARDDRRLGGGARAIRTGRLGCRRRWAPTPNYVKSYDEGRPRK